MTEELIELATGRFYIDGEPEVRLRLKQRNELPSSGHLVAVTTIMGDGEEPVGLTCSIFSTKLETDRAESLAKSEIAGRVEASGGRVLSQASQVLSGLPEDISRHVVIAMLRESRLHFH